MNAGLQRLVPPNKTADGRAWTLSAPQPAC